MTRIVWNQEEKAILLDEMVNLLVADPDIITRDILARAQIRLPVERRRDVSYNMVFNYKSMVARAERIAQTRRATAKEEPPPAPPPTPAELPLGDLVETIMQRFAVMVAEEVVKRNPHGFHLHYPRTVVAETKVEDISSKPKKPGILIIGLNGQQVTIIKQRFPQKDLMFVTAEDAKSYAPIKRDHTILMTKFISHAVQSRYRQVPNLQFCNGGVSDLTSMLNRIH